jgi:hypothetical protein
VLEHWLVESGFAWRDGERIVPTRLGRDVSVCLEPLV